MTLATPVTTTTISIGISITIVEVAIAMRMTVISIAVTIAMAAMAVPTRCDTARQCQANEKQNSHENQFFIHIITPFLSPLSI
jgi:hypothetical protein